jgi:DNA-binding LacI/PurR family transcriptional regulator
VSTSTVSNVLNGRSDRMAKETLARVEAAIRALKYRPNTSARQLKTGHTPLIGLLVPSMANPMYGSSRARSRRWRRSATAFAS